MSSRSRNSGRGSSGKPRGHDGDRIGAEDLGTERRREDSGKDTSRKEDFVKHGKSQKNKHPREEQQPSANTERRKAEKQRREALEAARKEQREQKKREEEEKARLEAEKRREEEEERQRVEEQLRKEEEERRRKEEEEQHAREMVSDIAARNRQKVEVRQSNLAAKETQLDETAIRSLDSSVKKNTTFVKKLRSVTEQQRDALAAEFNQLNLSKYVQEAVTSFAEAKLKMADISCAVHLCCLFHQRYADFSKLLLVAIEKLFAGGVAKDKPTNVTMQRVFLRFFGELVVSGIFENGGVSNLLHVFSAMVHGDKDTHAYLPVVLSFCRHCGEDLAGLTSKKQRTLLAKFHLDVEKTESFLPPDKQMLFRKLMFDYYGSLSDHLVADLKAVQKVERRNRHSMMTKGEVSAERQEEADSLRKSYDKLLSNTTTLADVLDKDLPSLPEDELPEVNDLVGVDFVKTAEGGSGESALSLWEDEDTRTFYENLVDLKSVVPGILFKEKEKESAKAASEAAATNSGSSPPDGSTADGANEVLLAEAESDAAIAAMMEEISMQEQEPVVIEDIEEAPSSSSTATASSSGKLLDELITRLPQCVNRDMIDEAATSFCLHMNTKANRNRLIKTLFTVKRNRLDMLPFCGRFVATLDPCLPDIALDLCQWLLKDFRYLVFQKGQTNIESKIKSVRYIGELTKFKVMAKSETIHCLKILLHEFKHHNVEMACQLLETCGRFLFRSPDSHLRTKLLLDTMVRKKAVSHFDGRQHTMIDNALHYCNPPDVPRVTRKIRPPQHEYMRKLLFKDLNRLSVEKVLRQVRKFPWKNPEINVYGIKCFTRVWRLKYNNIHCLANVLSGLETHQEDVAIHVVDGILEEVRIGMEVNAEKHNQRRLAVVRFLGEMYNYRLVEAAVIFRTLYMFLGFGNTPDGSPSPVDPPDNYFRVRLVCCLLDTCGLYFDHGSAKKKLDVFLIFFQLYIFYKENPVPLEIDYLVSDTLEMLRPKTKPFGTKEEALAAAHDLENEFLARREKLRESDKFAGDQQRLHPNTGDIVGAEMAGVSSQQQDEDDGDDSDSDLERGPRRDELEDEEGGTTEEEAMFGQDEEQEVVFRNGPKRIECQEDDEFLADFDKLMNDNVTARRTDAPTVPVFDLPVPVAGTRAEEPTADGMVKFSLIMKRGNKLVRRGVDVSGDSEIATSWREHRQADAERVRKERSELKRFVLDYEQRQEEEAYTEAMNDLQKPVQPRVYQPRHGDGPRGDGSRYSERDKRPIYHHRGPPAPSSIDSSPFPAPGPRRR